MEYKGKQYEEVTEGSGKRGDLLHVTECDDEKCDVWCFTTDDSYFYPLIDTNLTDGYNVLDFEGDTFTRYREIEQESDHDDLKTRVDNLYKDMSALLIAKNENYGDSFAKQFEKYGMISVDMRLNDKMLRLGQLVQGERDKVGESVEDTLKDIIGYATLALVELGRGDE